MASRKLYLIPVLILTYFFVHFGTDLFYFLKPRQTFLQIILYTIITATLYGSGYIIFKHKKKYTLTFSTLFFLFLFYGAVIDLIRGFLKLNAGFGVGLTMVFAFMLICILIITGCYFLSERMVNKCLKFWAIYCCVLIIYDIVLFFMFAKPEKKYLVTHVENKNLELNDKPTIFYLVFDMYPSDQVLKNYFSFTDTTLSYYLNSNRFFTTNNSRSLYNQTQFSLGSTFSLDTLHYYNDSKIKDYKKRLIAIKNIQHSPLISLFEKSGYTIRNYSLFDIIDQPSKLRFNLNYHLDNILTGTTFYNRQYQGLETDLILANRNINLEPFKKSWSSDVRHDLAFLRKSLFNLLDSIPANKASFNYFHFMMPHPPILYDSNGRDVRVKNRYSNTGLKTAAAHYTSYIRYVNKEIIKMSDSILNKTGKKAIIIIQGDHGYREFTGIFPSEVQYGIQNSIYLPSGNYSGFSNTLTPIQTFGLVLKNELYK